MSSGKLIFRYGAMGSAKTAHLLMTAFNFEEKGKKVYLVKPSIDTRSGNKISSRVPGLEKECILIDSNDKVLSSIHREMTENDYIDQILDNVSILPDMSLESSSSKAISEIILVDEAQFLTSDQVDELSNLVDNLGFLVICYGLRTDSNTHLFEGSKRLMELADTIEEIKSMCSCGHKAIINARFDEYGNILHNVENQVEIGGNERYISVCRKCYNYNKQD